MKYRLDRLMFWISGILLGTGCIHLYLDWIHYNVTLNSAPFSLWILTNGVSFGIPAFCCLIIGLVIKRRKKRKDE